ncbi:hypothetical protein EJ05DRAFT_492916 [Pseudovirgaria hyperparasitica]|uniref:PXA domain-containing protein n=1 Tax=Pseudovirgaria hyperparasitica TaxID=470096 RepID=A0A6A6W799_9PEZI|nr:uncharacterized protein EJ05DRAFT_492916 [Pseudovirgaria hyperparasitica]KAF2757830.1 hypothetical protein EJ05DRAFT_492916 [Pseudovirgaria hyperparasitica]
MERPISKAYQAELERQAQEAISDKATISFIRRALCSRNALANTITGGEKGGSTPQPIEDLLPPLTSSNDVDLQLYAIIAVIFKEFVFTWYSKITPDHVFPDEVLQTIAHCTRALEQRVRKVDLEALLLDEIPDVLQSHINAYRVATRTSMSNALASSKQQIYHTLNPHPALSPVPGDMSSSSTLEQKENEVAWRQLLVQGILAVLLPTEDLENGCLRALVAEIFSEMILGGGISEKACEPWLLWEATTKIIETVKPRTAQGEQYGTNVAQRSNRHPDPDSTNSPKSSQKSRHRRGFHHAASSVLSSFWAVLQYVFLAWYTIRAAMVILARSSSLPSRSMAAWSVPIPVEDTTQQWLRPKEHTAALMHQDSKQPVVSMKAWSCISLVIELDSHMPWLSGFTSFLHWASLEGPGRVGETGGVLDRLLSHYVHNSLLNPQLIPPLLRSVRAALFPRNAMAPARVPPSQEEILEIKRRCARSVANVLPQQVTKVYFATSCLDQVEAEVEDLLDVLGDKYCNKTLMFSLIELVIVRLLPEIADKGIVSLMEERLGEMSSNN